MAWLSTGNTTTLRIIGQVNPELVHCIFNPDVFLLTGLELTHISLTSAPCRWPEKLKRPVGWVCGKADLEGNQAPQKTSPRSRVTGCPHPRSRAALRQKCEGLPHCFPQGPEEQCHQHCAAWSLPRSGRAETLVSGMSCPPHPSPLFTSPTPKFPRYREQLPLVVTLPCPFSDTKPLSPSAGASCWGCFQLAVVEGPSLLPT